MKRRGFIGVMLSSPVAALLAPATGASYVLPAATLTASRTITLGTEPVGVMFVFWRDQPGNVRHLVGRPGAAFAIT
jgi:hypothetical protein